ncbi:MAG: zinc ABC transporter [Candidatus Liberibacter ctenarytainae]|uniref:High-affinity zinc uptake system protein ZnuA n=1 Tax=Candidatus Liberibacter ctenarytainae TaxID=2020335 RepID=A0A937DLP9_9HYPH|nr:zinc ABC transporter [Candidatus Liberibacter ctenarytainae]
MNFFLMSFIVVFFVLDSISMAQNLRVVASIKPIHSIVSSIMNGAGNPTLLVKDNSSPHEYHFRPSDITALENADIIFWVGPEMEMFLVKPLSFLQKRDNVVTLFNSPNIYKILLHEGQNDVPNDHKGHHHHGDTAYDMHIWLDPINVKHMAHSIAVELIKKDPNNKSIYENNAKNFEMRLEQLDRELSHILQPFRREKILVFHGAYKYFAHRYGVQIIDTVMSGSVSPGARSLQKIREKVISNNISCAFYEPEFNPRMIKSITDGTDIVIGTLDPEGIFLESSPDLYFQLMKNLATSIERNCVSKNR